MGCYVRNGRKSFFGFDCTDFYEDHLISELFVSAGGYADVYEYGGRSPSFLETVPVASSSVGECVRCHEIIKSNSTLPLTLYIKELELKNKNIGIVIKS